MTLKRIFSSKPVLFLEVAILLFFAFNVGKEMYKKHSIEQEVSRLEAEIGKLENNKSELAALLSYVKTDTFVEQEAREKLNLAGEGESLLLMPDADAANASTSPEETENLSSETPGIAKDDPARLAENSNLGRWWKYFFEHERLGEE